MDIRFVTMMAMVVLMMPSSVEEICFGTRIGFPLGFGLFIPNMVSQVVELVTEIQLLFGDCYSAFY